VMKAPPSRQKRQAFQQEKKPKSIWDINENADSEAGDEDWKKSQVLGHYDKRKSMINDMISDESMRRIETAQKRKSVFDDSSSDESSEEERRLTVDVTNAKTGLSGRINFQQH